MAFYNLKCSNVYCIETKEIEKGMNDPFPIVACPKCNYIMTRDYQSEMNDKSIVIPEHMKAAESMKSNFNYDKSPSGKKHIFPTGK